MKSLPVLLFFTLVVLMNACLQQPAENCVHALRQRDEQLMARVDSIMNPSADAPPEAKRKALEVLLPEEELLFRDARQCDFGNDLTAYHYWHRGRLKFPGKIEMALKKLDQ